MAAKYDRNPVPHRHLKTGVRGADVKRLQVAVNTRLKRKKARTRIHADGELGPKTIVAYRRAAYLIGLPHNKLTVGCQALMRNPGGRTPAMVARGRRHVKEWRSRGNGTLRGKALKVAQSLIGIMEQGGNNRGRQVEAIIHANGGTVPEPWCGDTVAYCYRHAGSKCVSRAWAAVVNLGRLLGMGRIKNPDGGDIACYVFDHTGEFEKWIGGGWFYAVEGNTGASGAVSDSSTGGDGVYRKRRHVSQVSRFVRVYR